MSFGRRRASGPARGEFAAAEAALAEARQKHDLEPPRAIEFLVELGELALARSRDDEAVEHFTEVEALWARTAEPDFLPLARVRFSVARALTGETSPAPADALARAEAALAAFRAKHVTSEAETVEAWLKQHR